MTRVAENQNTRQPVEEALGGVIRDWRRARKFSSRQVAEASGIDRKSLRAYERGENIPGAGAIDRLAIAFGVLASDILAMAEWRAGLRAEPPAGVGVKLSRTASPVPGRAERAVKGGNSPSAAAGRAVI